MIVTGKIKDPRVTPFLSITRVVVSSDLSHARVYVSGIENDEKKTKKGVIGLQTASGYIRTQLSKQMHVYQFPELTFFVDESMQAGLTMLDTLDKLAAEREARDNAASKTQHAEQADEHATGINKSESAAGPTH